jgi:type I restriction enzyme, S subunit
MAYKAVTTPIAELIDSGDLVINDGYRAKNAELSSHGLPFARALNVNNGFHFEGADFFPEEDLGKVGIKISEPGDVVFTSKGTVGRFAFVKPNTPRFVYAPQLCFWRVLNRNRIHARWVYYWMHTREFFVQFSGVSGQTDMAEYVSLRDQRRMHITLPPLPEQQAIASILGTLDDKIELNRQRNRTLEAMARAIFQSWFVDFDPVKAKVSGRQPPGLASDLADLFSDEFEESSLGTIPKGWTVGTIKANARRIQYGLTASASQEPTGSRFLRITDIRGGAVCWGEVPYCQASDNDKEKYQICDGDIVVARTGASTGENVYLVDPPEAIFASYLVRFQFSEPGYARIVAEFMRSEHYFEFVKSSVGGSAQPNANAQTLSGASLVFPPTRLAQTYYDLVRPLDKNRALQDYESRTLSSLRDTLLPKLISGELRVPDAERIVERAV